MVVDPRDDQTPGPNMLSPGCLGQQMQGAAKVLVSLAESLTRFGAALLEAEAQMQKKEGGKQ